MPQAPYDIIYEDEILIAVNKPAGLLSIPDRYDPELPNLQQLLHARYKDIYTVHRLDRPTSGMILFARTANAHRALSMQFENRTIRKLYYGLVHGTPMPAEGEIMAAIARHPVQAGRMTIHAKGKPSHTHYHTLETMGQYSLVALQPHTGRTHQLRVHLEYIGHPLLADDLYGKEKDWYLSQLKGRRYRRSKEDRPERPLLSRVALHSAQLTLTHPGDARQLTLEAPLPKDMQASLNQLRKWSL